MNQLRDVLAPLVLPSTQADHIRNNTAQSRPAPDRDRDVAELATLAVATIVSQQQLALRDADFLYQVAFRHLVHRTAAA